MSKSEKENQLRSKIFKLILMVILVIFVSLLTNVSAFNKLQSSLLKARQDNGYPQDKALFDLVNKNLLVHFSHT